MVAPQRWHPSPNVPLGKCIPYSFETYFPNHHGQGTMWESQELLNIIQTVYWHIPPIEFNKKTPISSLDTEVQLSILQDYKERPQERISKDVVGVRAIAEATSCLPKLVDVSVLDSTLRVPDDNLKFLNQFFLKYKLSVSIEDQLHRSSKHFEMKKGFTEKKVSFPDGIKDTYYHWNPITERQKQIDNVQALTWNLKRILSCLSQTLLLPS